MVFSKGGLMALSYRQEFDRPVEKSGLVIRLLEAGDSDGALQAMKELHEELRALRCKEREELVVD
jgi:hypothetical protein